MDVATGHQIAALAHPVGTAIDSQAFSPNGKTLAMGGRDGRAYLWDAATGRQIATLTDPGNMGQIIDVQPRR